MPIGYTKFHQRGVMRTSARQACAMLRSTASTIKYSHASYPRGICARPQRVVLPETRAWLHSRPMFATKATFRRACAANRLSRRYPCAVRHEFHCSVPDQDFQKTSETTRLKRLMEMGHEYYLIDEVETLEAYRPGGLHPVKIGDEYKDKRYRVVAKLGFGSYSTVWLARDTHTHSLVAIKFPLAESNNREAEILSLLNEGARGPSQEFPGSSSSDMTTGDLLVAPLLDNFMVSGPNGIHSCIVTEVASCNLHDCKDCGYFQNDVARALAVQLVQAVALLHASEVVHGDIRLANILLRMPSKLKPPNDCELYEKFGAPVCYDVRRPDDKPLGPGVPSQGVISTWFGNLGKNVTLSEASLFLNDFGEAFMPSQGNRLYSNTPFFCRSPEASFEPEVPLSSAADIWSLAIAIWEIFANNPPFYEWSGNPDQLVCRQVEALGLFPSHWMHKWKDRLKYFNEDDTPRSERFIETLEQLFDDTVQGDRSRYGIPDISAKEKTSFLSMIRPMLSLPPANRPTAEQVLESEWMKTWALPDYRKMQMLRSSPESLGEKRT